MIDLHCHLDGSLNIGLMSEVSGRKVHEDEVRVSRDCTSLTEYLEKFNLPISCIQTEKNLYDFARQFILDVHKEGIEYIEVRFAPLFSCMQGLNVKKVMESVIEGLKSASKETGVDFGVIACAMRNHNPKESAQMFKDIRDFYKHGLCGVDLAGDESKFSTYDFFDLFKTASDLGYNYTIHAGEASGIESVKAAIEMGAKRIGHGIALRGHEDVMKLCLKKGIGIEMCPTSNIQTRAVDGFSNYPLKEFLDYGLKVSVNTDNRTVSQVGLKDEFELVKRFCNITQEDEQKLNENARETAFLF